MCRQGEKHSISQVVHLSFSPDTSGQGLCWGWTPAGSASDPIQVSIQLFILFCEPSLKSTYCSAPDWCSHEPPGSAADLTQELWDNLLDEQEQLPPAHLLVGIILSLTDDQEAIMSWEGSDLFYNAHGTASVLGNSVLLSLVENFYRPLTDLQTQPLLCGKSNLLWKSPDTRPCLHGPLANHFQHMH